MGEAGAEAEAEAEAEAMCGLQGKQVARVGSRGMGDTAAHPGGGGAAGGVIISAGSYDYGRLN